MLFSDDQVLPINIPYNISHHASDVVISFNLLLSSHAESIPKIRYENVTSINPDNILRNDDAETQSNHHVLDTKHRARGETVANDLGNNALSDTADDVQNNRNVDVLTDPDMQIFRVTSHDVEIDLRLNNSITEVGINGRYHSLDTG